MRLLVASDPRFARHETGPGHPERPARIGAVLGGIAASGVGEAVIEVEPSPADPSLVSVVHPGRYLADLEAACATGGHLDADTVVSPGSFEAALYAAGAGLELGERLTGGEGDAGLCVVRPPGHHATPRRPMGFCLLNNVAVAARLLADRGERVLIVDYDAHHGNGTQDVFWSDPRVVYVSTHQYPLYPGTGAADEIGGSGVEGTTINVPLPAGATGDVVVAALEDLVAPVVDRFAPTWLLVSAGFDGHRLDPLTGLGLSSGDFGEFTRRMLRWVPTGRTLVFLEGGYDLDVLCHATAATVAALAGTVPSVVGNPDLAADLRVSSGGPGGEVVVDVGHRLAALGHR